MSSKLDLSPFHPAALDAEAATIYALDPNLRIRFVNDAWWRFARDNGAPFSEDDAAVLGTHVMEPIPPVLRSFYGRLFQRGLERDEVVEHEYECSSPTQRRRFRMQLLPLTAGGLLVVHSPLIEIAQHEPALPRNEAIYRRADGLVLQCSSCRRVRRVDGQRGWEWVPDYVENPPAKVSHGLCAVCSTYYYADSENRE